MTQNKIQKSTVQTTAIAVVIINNDKNYEPNNNIINSS